MNYKVSVIIPIFNQEKYLVSCLDSILNQTLTSIEIILIDDASSDLSGEICRHYSKLDKRIAIYKNTINRGVSAARNIGLKKARGQYIMFVDSDDYVDLKACEVLYDNASNKNLDIIVGRTTKRQYDTKICDQVISGYEYLSYSLMCERYQVVVWLKMIKNSYISQRKLRFAEGLFFEDHLFSLQLFCDHNSRVMDTNYGFYHYNVDNAESFMHNIDDSKLAMYDEIIQKMIDYSNSLPLMDRGISEKAISFSQVKYPLMY